MCVYIGLCSDSIEYLNLSDTTVYAHLSLIYHTDHNSRNQIFLSKTENCFGLYVLFV